MFKDQLVPLHPDYEVEKDGDDFHITKIPNPSPRQERGQLDVIAIVGKNGVGKSTFLKMLRGLYSFDAEYSFCWIDTNGNIATFNIDRPLFNNGEVVDLECELDSYVADFKISDLCGFKNLGEENTVERGLLDFYHKEPEIFDIHGVPLFDGFELHLNEDGDYKDEVYERLERHTGIEIDYFEYKELIKNHPSFLILASIANDSTFESIADRLELDPEHRNLEFVYSTLRTEESELIDKQLLELIFKDGNPDYIPTTQRGRTTTSPPKQVIYEISDYPLIKKKIDELSDKIDQWMLKLRDQNEYLLREKHEVHLHIWERRLNSVINFVPVQKRDNETISINQLSQGEIQQIETLFSIGPMIVPEYSNWYPFDDCDAHLHPEWSRRFVSYLKHTHQKFCENISQIKDNDRYATTPMTSLVVTHSPFVLSDLHSTSVLKFDKERDADGNEIPKGRTIITRADTSPFAANIGELLHDDFFMKSTIGEYAKTQIQQSIVALSENPSDKVTQAKAQALFEQVGDTVLKRLLLEKVKYAKNRSE